VKRLYRRRLSFNVMINYKCKPFRPTFLPVEQRLARKKRSYLKDENVSATLFAPIMKGSPPR